MTKKPRTELKHIRMAGHVSGWKTDVLNIQILETSGSILWCFEDQKAPKWMRNVLYSPFQLPKRLGNEEHLLFRVYKHPFLLQSFDLPNA